MLDSLREKREKVLINKIRNETGEITTDTTEIQKIKRILWTAICQHIGQPIRNGQILRTVQPSKTESWRNGKSEESDHKYRGWNSNQKALRNQNS